MLEAIADLSAWVLILSGTTTGFGGLLWADRIINRVKATEVEVKIDGRTPNEWYELIKSMGKEEYERLSRALDGVDTNYGKWDAKPLLLTYYDTLMRDWYPERYIKDCVYCAPVRPQEGLPCLLGR